MVPSHIQNEKNDSGIAELARRLARNGRIDKIDFLVRTRTIDKLAHGGSCDLHVQLDSIGVNSDMKSVVSLAKKSKIIE